ncbi:hypothetical protein BY996DRAFT_6578567 [Phakopsora pachyrhizi]|uniref:Uncharacterized protein n=1 Tax=Phakopsora pachyrhizi TaxID=170000 RepID=A0AAV0AQ91_PHAPC|nr:hypothetical protein BY996DRAFT_6578567 [Phakopsora pachyrhizi]CAH7671338.1 hypothetical protein PPACK8108_LOCUS6110 [Phakopsora pachyrhizi]
MIDEGELITPPVNRTTSTKPRVHPEVECDLQSCQPRAQGRQGQAGSWAGWGLACFAWAGSWAGRAGWAGKGWLGWVLGRLGRLGIGLAGLGWVLGRLGLGWAGFDSLLNHIQMIE